MKLIKHIMDQSGNAMVEFAIAGMTVIVLGMGGVDFGRLYYDSVAVAGAAHATVQYASFSVITAGDFPGMMSAGLADAQDVDGVTVSADHFCDCPDNTGVSVDCNQPVCTGYGLPRLYVRSRAGSTFNTIGAYPGIPATTAVTMRNWIRAR